MKTPRQTALDALIKMETKEGYSNLVLDNIIRTEKLNLRDSSFVTALVYGVIERQITLDFVISKYSKTPIKKLSPQVLQILRLSIYQLMYMDSVPTNAAVNEGVNMAKANKVTSATGFINGVLRSFVRDNCRMPQIKGDMAEVLSVEYSCPKPLIEKLTKQLGEEKTKEILTSSQGAPPTYIRVNTTKISTEDFVNFLKEKGAETEETNIPNCLRLKQGGDITRLSGYTRGYFHVQDMASQICAELVVHDKPLKTLDVCAAPGGKSFTMAEIIGDKGIVLALDLHENRVNLIKDGAKRLGLGNVEAKVQDATQFNEDLGLFDAVLCDVPCSGFGIIRRKPEIKYKNLDEIKNLFQIQYKILENSSKYVTVGGVLVYSTCTLLDEENTQVVNKFLENNKDFEPYNKENYCQTFIPNKEGSDGFFISKIRRVK